MARSHDSVSSFCRRSPRVVLLGLGRRDVADGLQQPAIVEPVDPFQRCELDGFERPPRPAPMDDLGFVKSVDGFGQSVDAPIKVKWRFAPILPAWACGRD